MSILPPPPKTGHPLAPLWRKAEPRDFWKGSRFQGTRSDLILASSRPAATRARRASCYIPEVSPLRSLGPSTVAKILTAGSLLALTGCAYPFSALSPFSRTNARVLEETSLGGVSAGNARPGDAVVRVWIGRGTCSGVLVAPRVVLTARHCITETTASREATSRPKVPGALHVELGGDYLPWGRVAVTGVHVCEASPNEERDLAALLLDRPVPPDVPLLALGSPRDDGRYAVLGFGSDVWPKTVGGITAEAKRRHVTRGSVKSTSPDTVTVHAATLHGDSGGAVVDLETRALVAVVSRGDYAERAMDNVRYGDITVGARVDRCEHAVRAALVAAEPAGAASRARRVATARD